MNTKYQLHRLDIETGDVILFHKIGIVAKGISWADSNAYYTHCGIAKWIERSLFIIDSDPAIGRAQDGLQIRRLSREMEQTADWCILRRRMYTPYILHYAMRRLLLKVDTGAAYGWRGILARLLRYRFQKTISPGNLPICSDICEQYLQDLGIKCYDKEILLSPQDLLRHASKEEIEVLLNDSI